MAQLVARDIWDVEAAGSNPVTPTRLSLDADRVQALSYASVLADMYHAYYKYDGNLSYPLYLLRSYLREI